MGKAAGVSALRLSAGSTAATPAAVRSLAARRCRLPAMGWPSSRPSAGAAPAFSTASMDQFDMVARQEGTSFVDSVSPNGLVSVNGVLIQGSVLVFDRMCLLWHVQTVEDVGEDSLAMLFAVHPRPEMLILGVGEKGGLLPKTLVEACRRHGVTVEAMSRQNAAAQFNVLQADGRRVAVGFPHAAPHIT